MAVIVFKDRHIRVVSPYQGKKIWQILNGEVQPNPNEARYCRMIQHVYLNRANPETPKSYLNAHKHLLRDERPVVVREPEKWQPFETRKDLQ